MSNRPGWDEYFMNFAINAATRGTCYRRKVGCVLINKHNHIIATGYNGLPPGFPHCQGKNKCWGAFEKSGEGLGLCGAIHAEQNALLQCRDVQEIQTLYVTVSPCVDVCIKLLLATSCKRIVYLEEYSQHKQSKQLWEKRNHSPTTLFNNPNLFNRTMEKYNAK